MNKVCGVYSGCLCKGCDLDQLYRPFESRFQKAHLNFIIWTIRNTQLIWLKYEITKNYLYFAARQDKTRQDMKVSMKFHIWDAFFLRKDSFASTKKILVTKAYRAKYDVLKKGRVHKLSMWCQYDMFDKIVEPILLYGCEFRGSVI